MASPVGGRRVVKVLMNPESSLAGPETVMSSTIAVQETFTSLTARVRSGWRPRHNRRQPRVQPCLGPVSEEITAATSPLLTTRS